MVSELSFLGGGWFWGYEVFDGAGWGWPQAGRLCSLVVFRGWLVCRFWAAVQGVALSRKELSLHAIE